MPPPAKKSLVPEAATVKALATPSPIFQVATALALAPRKYAAGLALVKAGLKNMPLLPSWRATAMLSAKMALVRPR